MKNSLHLFSWFYSKKNCYLCTKIHGKRIRWTVRVWTNVFQFENKLPKPRITIEIGRTASRFTVNLAQSVRPLKWLKKRMLFFRWDFNEVSCLQAQRILLPDHRDEREALSVEYNKDPDVSCVSYSIKRVCLSLSFSLTHTRTHTCACKKVCTYCIVK